MDQRCYKQLTARDRLLISQLKAKKFNQTEIARRIGKDKSTVSRELRRNTIEVTPQDRYFYFRISQFWSEEQLDEFLATQPAEERETQIVYSHSDAHLMAINRAFAAQRRRRGKRPETREWIVERIQSGWSPQQIAGRSKVDGPESVSHEFVYELVRRNRKSGGGLHRRLKRFGKRKQRNGAREYPHKKPVRTNRVSIEKRPAIVDKRRRLGDCEADLIVGYKGGFILSVIDRTSRAVVLRKLETKRMDEVCAQLVIAFALLGVVLTLTVDNGKEFYAHLELTERTGVRVFFAHPYCSSERGSIENANGLVRYYLPKGTPFADLSQQRLDEIATFLNDRPRKCLGYLTPYEVQSKDNQLCTLQRVALVG